MKIIEGDKVTYIDCDDTLVSWSTYLINLYPEQCKVFKTWKGDPGTSLLPIEETIDYLKKSKIHGGTVIVWSAGGWEWAKNVVEVLELTEYVDAVMSKPIRYVDDLPSGKFMGTWVNLEPKFKKRMKK